MITANHGCCKLESEVGGSGHLGGSGPQERAGGSGSQHSAPGAPGILLQRGEPGGSGEVAGGPEMKRGGRGSPKSRGGTPGAGFKPAPAVF